MSLGSPKGILFEFELQSNPKIACSYVLDRWNSQSSVFAWWYTRQRKTLGISLDTICNHVPRSIKVAQIQEVVMLGKVMIDRADLLSKLAKENWLVAVVLNELSDIVRSSIHLTVHIRRFGLMILLIVDNTTWISLSNPLTHGSVVLTIETLVAKRPDDNGGMVLVSLNKLTGSVDICVFPVRVIGQPLCCLFLSIFKGPETMTLKIGLADDVEPEFICHIEKVRVVRLMSCTDGVDVGFLHEDKIFSHVLVADCAAREMMVLMSIDTVNDDWFSVDVKVGTLHLNSSKPSLLTYCSAVEGDE
ncbi:hypothetical protein HG531_002795 [Fusarium graminearum]|nr:hypothetical protein HG531_002795 [Fusarium graminearum]